MGRRILTLLTVWIILSAFQCEKEGEDCHYSIAIINNSSDTIISARISPGVTHSGDSTIFVCGFLGRLLYPGESYDYRPYNWCIENRLNNSSEKIVRYFIDGNNYDLNMQVPCDSVHLLFEANTVLKEYELTLEDLRAMDFKITYP